MKGMFFIKGMLSLKAWAAEGGGNFDKKNVFDKRNVVVQSMGCRGGGEKILIKGSQVGSQMTPGNLNH